MDFLQLFQGIHELMEQSMEPPRHIRPEDEASNTYYVVYLAQRASEPGVPQQLYQHLCHPHTLVNTLILVFTRLQDLSQKTKLDLGSCLVEEQIAILLDENWGRMPRPPAKLEPFDKASLDERGLVADPQAEGFWADPEWGTLALIMTALRVATCAMPLSLAIVDSSQDQNLVDATMVMIGMALRVVRVWLNKERAEGRPSFPPHLVRFCLLAVDTYTAILPRLPPRDGDHNCTMIMVHIAGGILTDLLSHVPLSSLVLDKQLPPSSLSAAAGRSAGGSSSGGGGSRNTSKPRGKGKGKGKGSTKGQARGGTGGQDSQATVDGGSYEAGAAADPLGSGSAAVQCGSAATALEDGLDLRGLVHACWQGVTRAAQVGPKCGRVVRGREIHMLTSRIASHLRALHLATPRPITDPCPALRCSGLTANLPSIIYDDFPSSQQGYYGCGYPGGRLWEPNTYSLGPAPAVLAGAEAVGAVTAIVPTQDPITTEEVLSMVTYTASLTQLAQAMTKEAEGDYFFQRMRADARAMQAWCATVEGMSFTVQEQLALLGQFVSMAEYDEVAQQGNLTLKRKCPPPGTQKPTGDQKPSVPRKKKAGSTRGAPQEILLKQETIALLPVMAATALQLAFHALACVRLMSSKVLSSEALLPLEGRRAYGSARSLVHAASAIKSAFTMYSFLTRWASHYRADISSTGGPSSSTAGTSGSTAGPSRSTVGSTSSTGGSSSSTGGSSSTTGGTLSSDVQRSDIIPPDYERYCAAVSVWGLNLKCIMDMVGTVLPLLYTPNSLGGAPYLHSWWTGSRSGYDLIQHTAQVLDSAAKVMKATKGDLAGWLGDLAPRGDLDSTQLFYRMAGIETDAFIHIVNSDRINAIPGTVLRMLLQLGVPMLGLVNRISLLGEIQRQSKDRSKRDASTLVGAQQQGSRSGGGNGAQSGTSGSSSGKYGSTQSTTGSSQGSTPDELGAAFLEAWQRSPVTIGRVVTACNTFENTFQTMCTVMDVMECRVKACCVRDRHPLIDQLAVPHDWHESVHKYGLHFGAPQGHAEAEAKRIAEPLHGLIEAERQVVTNTSRDAPQYRPKEAARHSQRLQAYVEAAAARAAGQLEPGLKRELYEALGLSTSPTSTSDGLK